MDQLPVIEVTLISPEGVKKTTRVAKNINSGLVIYDPKNGPVLTPMAMKQGWQIVLQGEDLANRKAQLKAELARLEQSGGVMGKPEAKPEPPPADDHDTKKRLGK